MLSYPIAVFFNNMELIIPTIVVSVKFIFDSLTYIPIAILNKKLDFNSIGKIRLSGTTFQIVMMIVFAFMGFSYWSLIIPVIFNPIVQYLLLRRKVKLPIRIYGWRATKRMIYRIRSLMGNLSLNNLVRYWSNHADKVVIGRLYMQSDLGLYNRAFRFVQITNHLITGIFSSVLFPSLKQLIDEKGDANREYLDIVKIITLFNLPVVIILVILPEILVRILWGNDWIGVAPFLPYVGLIITFNSIISTMVPVFLLYGKERNLFLVNLASSMMTIVLVIVGGLFSIMHVIKFLALGYLFFTIPVNIYFGFYRSFGFKIGLMLRFWIPTLMFGMFLFISITCDSTLLKLLIIIFYMGFLFYELRGTAKESLKYLLKRIRKKKEA
jgi:PST family polysaccharide transporter